MFIRIEKESLERYGRSEALAKRILDLAKPGDGRLFQCHGPAEANPESIAGV